MAISVECSRHKTNGSFSSFEMSNATHTGQVIIIMRSAVQGRESDIHPISPKTPAPQYQPIDRKKRKRKIVEDYSSERAA